MSFSLERLGGRVDKSDVLESEDEDDEDVDEDDSSERCDLFSYPKDSFISFSSSCRKKKYFKESLVT